MRIEAFAAKHIAEARNLALCNYREERKATPVLPEIKEMPDLVYYSEQGMGVVALENDRMIGFLCFLSPRNEMFGTHAKGTFSPLHAHGAVYENRERIYQRLYETAAELLVKKGVFYHALALYANDHVGQQAFFNYGFGSRCMDEIRPMETISGIEFPEVMFTELPLDEFPKVREMRVALNRHLTNSPCFMVSIEQDVENWLKKVEGGDRRTFIARNTEGEILAYLDVAEEGENFVTYRYEMMNLQGAYCLPEHRGTGIMEALLDYVILILKDEGCRLLGVDHETFNPNALNFWKKHFTPYTRSVVRRVDESFLD